MPRPERLDTLLEVASEQAGYVTAAQAARLGVAQKRLPRLVETGDLRRLRNGVYALRHAHHPEEAEIAAWLALDRKSLPWEREALPVAVLSHASAAALHGLGTIIPALPALTVPPEQGRPSRGLGLELHHARLTRDDWQWLTLRDGLRLPATTPARTIVDLLLVGEEPSYLERAVAEALADGRLSAAELDAAAVRRKQRSGKLREQARRLLPVGGL